MAKPVPECWSSCTRTPGTISPSMTNSAWAMARSATETQRQSLTGSPLMAPAMDSSSLPWMHSLWMVTSEQPVSGCVA